MAAPAERTNVSVIGTCDHVRADGTIAIKIESIGFLGTQDAAPVGGGQLPTAAPDTKRRRFPLTASGAPTSAGAATVVQAPVASTSGTPSTVTGPSGMNTANAGATEANAQDNEGSRQLFEPVM